MKTNFAIKMALIAVAVSGCSKAPVQTSEPFPKYGRHYMYVGDTLIASFDILGSSTSSESRDSPYHSELFAGNLTTQYDDEFKRERDTLTGGSVIFRSNKDNSEVARFTAERIVWWGQVK